MRRKGILAYRTTRSSLREAQSNSQKPSICKVIDDRARVPGHRLLAGILDLISADYGRRHEKVVPPDTTFVV